MWIEPLEASQSKQLALRTINLISNSQSYIRFCKTENRERDFVWNHVTLYFKFRKNLRMFRLVFSEIEKQVPIAILCATQRKLQKLDKVRLWRVSKRKSKAS